MTKKPLPVINVVAGLIENDRGALLLAQRPWNKPGSFLWEFPGGKLEPGETPEAALARELEEEVGIIVSPDTLKPFSFVSMTYPDFHIIFLSYKCQQWTGEPCAREGQGGLEWVMPQHLEQYTMPEANSALIPLLLGKNKDHLERSSSS